LNEWMTNSSRIPECMSRKTTDLIYGGLATFPTAQSA